MNRTGYCLELGIEDYSKIFKLQQRIHEARKQGNILDTVIFLEHYPCYTIGRKGGFEHILVSDRVLEQEGIKVYETDRGGDITYHGPGQLICYPIIDLNDYGRDVHVYARRMEKVIIRTLEQFGIEAGRRQGFPGVWVGSSKIAAMGIGLRHWVTMHGVSLNVCPNMKYFSLIVPCGLSAFGVTSMEIELNRPVSVSVLRKEMRRQYCQLFEIQLRDINLEEIEQRLEEVEGRDENA